MPSDAPPPNNACPACTADKPKFIGTKNDYAVHRCRECATLYSQRSRFDYDGYYDAHNLRVPAFIERRLDELITEFACHRQTNRFLDIGCGAGSLVEAARRAGWQAEGLEISKPAAQHVRSLGFEVFCGDLFQAAYPSNRFDIVTASELIEHLAEPFETLKEVGRILRPGGLLWGTTPNAGGLSLRLLGTEWTTVCPPEHVQLFTIAGIRQLMKRAGFSRVRVKSRSFNPMEVWHSLSSRARNNHKSDTGKHADAEQSSAETFDRVASSYRLNEAMLANPLNRTVKALANGALEMTGLGDSLRIEAIK